MPNGWITAKKSQAQIARDKVKAQQARRRKTKQQSSSQRRAKATDDDDALSSDDDFFKDDDDDDDDDSINDFVVHEDGEEEEENDEEEADWSEGDEDEEDDDDDEVISKVSHARKSSKKKTEVKRKTKQKPMKRHQEFSSDEDDDDSDDDFLTMSKRTKRKSKPAPHMLPERNTKQGTTIRNPFAARIPRKDEFVDVLTSPEEKTPVGKQQNRIQKKRPSPSSKKNNASDDEHGTSQSPPCKKMNLAEKRFVSLMSDDEDDDDAELLQDPFARNNNNKTTSTTTTARPKSSSKSSTSSSSSALAVSKFFAAPSTASHKTHESGAKSPPPQQQQHQTSPTAISNHDDTTPIVARRAQKNKTRVFLDDDDDDNNDDNSSSHNNQQAPQQHTTNDFEDSDEEMAMALAMSASMAEQKGKPKKNRFSKFAAPKSILEVLEDSDDEKEAQDDEDDNYGNEEEEELDEDAKEARSVLQTAQRLSGQILQTLKSWGASSGMIVHDGAIVFTGNDKGDDSADTTDASAVATTDDQKMSSTWISEETMKKVVPTVKLAPYQLIGVNWLAMLHKLTVDVNGTPTSVNGVLADEMGLGKTCQTISFLAWLKYHQTGEEPPQPKRNDRDAAISVDSDDDSIPPTSTNDSISSPHLIVVPASVLSNWSIEFEKFAPHLNVVKYHGSIAERQEIQSYLRQFLDRRTRWASESLDVILAPLTYFQKESSDDRSFLRKFRYDYLVCDEAHLLKNHQGLRYKTLNRFRTKHRLLLSGTPVMNNPQELMSLLCFLMPLFSRKSSEHDEDQYDGGSRMLQHFVSLDNEGKNDADAYRKLKELFAPFVLRRRKADVLSQIMPPKTRHVEFVQLDAVGRRIYNGVLEKHLKNKNRAAREHLFTQLRKAAHHPLLLRTRYLEPSEVNHLVDSFYKFGAFRGEGCTRERVKEELERFNDFDIHLTALDLLEQNPKREDDLRRYVLNEDDLFSSAKCQRLRSLLPELVSDGHRILIFSVWTNCLDLLSCLLEQLGMKYLRMEGSTAVSERQELIDEFNRDDSIPIFLLSTKACGLGINLTAADTCIMHDIDFNPFNDLQAEDRCHRIGQKKPVKVIKLVSKDTVDQDIYMMQERKAKMSAAIMESSSTSKFESKKERDNVLQSAVDRFLGSPAGHKGKENNKNFGLEKKDVL